MTTDPLTTAETVKVARALIAKQIADIRAKPFSFGFVVCGTWNLSPVYTTGARFQLSGDTIALFNVSQARKVAANFNRQTADQNSASQTYKFTPYEKWAPARIAHLQSMLDKLATLD